MKKSTYKILTSLMTLIMTQTAYAQSQPWDNTLTKILDALTGPAGTSIAILAVIVCGIMLLFGQMALKYFVGVLFGIAIIFGAEAIVTWIKP